MYFSIEIINKINFWTYKNFGACEREVQIDIIRVILRKTSHPDIVNHMLLLDEICMKNTLDLNQFFQLFLACLSNNQILFCEPEATRNSILGPENHLLISETIAKQEEGEANISEMFEKCSQEEDQENASTRHT